MKTTRKELRGLDTEVMMIIEKRAEKVGTTSNQLIKEMINDYARRIEEVEASKVLHAQIDDLVTANNRLIETQNQNTIIVGELARKIIERLDFYLPEKGENLESDDRR
ncbi:hypothetical protein [Leuconostoc pseudomesenteroides]|uniref:hypothetical protein n=1 Tax=Leuconostoc pseudomesenteroides TaxID=33968 RepID=UPI0032DF6A47